MKSLKQLLRQFRKRRHNGRRARHNFLSPAIECLEPRSMLAGDVLALLNAAGDLRLVGDDRDNSVEVVLVNGDTVVRGTDGTTVNGVVAPFVAFGGSPAIADDFFANLGDGDDFLLLDGVAITGQGNVNGGNGNNSVGFQNASTGGDLVIRTWGGEDIVNLNTVDVGDDLIISTWNERDTVNIENTTIADDLHVRTGTLRDSVVLNTVTVGDDVGVDLGWGADDLAVIDSNITDRLTAIMRSGDDFLFIDPTTIGGPTSIHAARGDDRVLVEGANQLSGLHAKMGRGIDPVEIDPATTNNGMMVTQKAEGNDVTDADRDARLNNPNNGALTKADAADTLFSGGPGTMTIPTTTGIGDVTVTEDAPDTLINLFNAFDDVEDTDQQLTFTVEANTNQSLVSTAIGAGGTLTLDFGEDENGNADITVRATDTDNQFVEAQFTVTVNPDGAIPLNLDITSSNNTTSSNGTLITNNPTLIIDGTTEANATVTVALDGDGVFDDGTTTADGTGQFSVSTTLSHTDANRGAHNIEVKARNAAGEDAINGGPVHLSVGTVVRYTSTEGNFDVELYDDDAPIAVANFLSYLDDWVNLIAQRLDDLTGTGGDILQLGRFTHSGTTLVEVPRKATILNEHDPSNPNVRGTLSMALPAGNPDGGSLESFFNLSNQTTFLDDPSRRHTVFGRVVGTGVEDVLDPIRDFSTFDVNQQFAAVSGGALSDVPLKNFIAGTPIQSNFVIINDIEIIVNPMFDAEVATGSFTETSLLGTRTDLLPGVPAADGNIHVTTTVDYAAQGFTNPPTHGPHHPFLAGITPRPTGVYATEQPDEDMVHALEHGNVWISYNPNIISHDDMHRLENLVRDGGTDTGVILTPRADNTRAISIASWARLLELDSFDAIQIGDFINTNRGHAPEGFIRSGQKTDTTGSEVLDDGLPHL
jgi:cyclophilin family peptidyl-prolyl cis-trans isomerase